MIPQQRFANFFVQIISHIYAESKYFDIFFNIQHYNTATQRLFIYVSNFITTVLTISLYR